MKTIVTRYLRRTALAMICATLSLPLCFVQAQEQQSDQQFEAIRTAQRAVTPGAASDMTEASTASRPEVRTSEESAALAQVWHPVVAISAAQSFQTPAAAGRATGELDIVDIASNGDVWHRWAWHPTGFWSPWGSLGRPPTGTSGAAKGPAIAGRRNGNLDVFVISNDDNVWHRWWSASTGWTPWGSIGGPTGNDRYLITITATGRATGELDVIVTDAPNTGPSNTRIWHKWWSASNGWSGWRLLAEAGFGSTAVAGRKSGELDLFFAGNSPLFHSWWSAGTGRWSPWGSLGGIVSGPAAAGRANGNLDVVGTGTDGAVWHKWWGSSSGWSGWGQLGGFPTGASISGPFIAALRDGQLYVFVKSFGGTIYLRWWG